MKLLHIFTVINTVANQKNIFLIETLLHFLNLYDIGFYLNEVKKGKNNFKTIVSKFYSFFKKIYRLSHKRRKVNNFQI